MNANFTVATEMSQTKSLLMCIDSTPRLLAIMLFFEKQIQLRVNRIVLFLPVNMITKSVIIKINQ